MDIMTLIDMYIELWTKSDNLRRFIREAEQNETYAKVEGTEAFYEGDYEREQILNDSVRYHREESEKAYDELVQLEDQLLKHIRISCFEAIHSMGENQLKETSKKLLEKVEGYEREIARLSGERQWAESKFDIAFENNNNEGQLNYNAIINHCRSEIDRITHLCSCYNFVIGSIEDTYKQKQALTSDVSSKKM